MITKKDPQYYLYLPGYFNFGFFYQWIGDCIPEGGNIVEVGVFFGKSLCYLGEYIQLLGKKDIMLYAVDTFKGTNQESDHAELIEKHGGNLLHSFMTNVQNANLSDMVTICHGESTKVANGFPNRCLDVVFIDASHKYEDVKADIIAWQSKVRPGGLLAGHDYESEEVQKAVEELLPGYTHEESVWMWLKPMENS